MTTAQYKEQQREKFQEEFVICNVRNEDDCGFRSDVRVEEVEAFIDQTIDGMEGLHRASTNVWIDKLNDVANFGTRAQIMKVLQNFFDYVNNSTPQDREEGGEE